MSDLKNRYLLIYDDYNTQIVYSYDICDAGYESYDYKRVVGIMKIPTE
jgi:hypothetical protein